MGMHMKNRNDLASTRTSSAGRWMVFGCVDAALAYISWKRSQQARVFRSHQYSGSPCGGCGATALPRNDHEIAPPPLEVAGFAVMADLHHTRKGILQNDCFPLTGIVYYRSDGNETKIFTFRESLEISDDYHDD